MIRIRIYLPETDVTRDYCMRLVDMSPGVTFTKGTGAWRDAKGVVVIEDVQIAEILTSPDAYPNYKEVAESFRKDARQDCVLITRETVKVDFLEK